jgi:hypothetical protein
MSPDPWSAFLDWLTTVLVPAWGELIGLLPYLVIVGVVGPLLTLIVLMWGWHLLSRRRGKVRRGPAEAAPAPRDEGGQPVFPVNVPYCQEHALVFPARARACTLDGEPLSVRCPVDGTVRNAELDTCTACGTRFKLGAAVPSSVVLANDGPPEGGAAVA